MFDFEEFMEASLFDLDENSARRSQCSCQPYKSEHSQSRFNSSSVRRHSSPGSLHPWQAGFHGAAASSAPHLPSCAATSAHNGFLPKGHPSQNSSNAGVVCGDRDSARQCDCNSKLPSALPTPPPNGYPSAIPPSPKPPALFFLPSSMSAPRYPCLNYHQKMLKLTPSAKDVGMSTLPLMNVVVEDSGCAVMMDPVALGLGPIRIPSPSKLASPAHQPVTTMSPQRQSLQLVQSPALAGPPLPPSTLPTSMARRPLSTTGHTTPASTFSDAQSFVDSRRGSDSLERDEQSDDVTVASSSSSSACPPRVSSCTVSQSSPQRLRTVSGAEAFSEGDTANDMDEDVEESGASDETANSHSGGDEEMLYFPSHGTFDWVEQYGEDDEKQHGLVPMHLVNEAIVPPTTIKPIKSFVTKRLLHPYHFYDDDDDTSTTPAPHRKGKPGRRKSFGSFARRNSQKWEGQPTPSFLGVSIGERAAELRPHPASVNPTSREGVSDIAACGSDDEVVRAQSRAAGGPLRVIEVCEKTYSSVSVFEMAVNGTAVMRRRSDGWINATHLLKVAGFIDKARRTKMLDALTHTGEHEKIQGGYGRYQGTWVPLQRAKELATEFEVYHLLHDLLEKEM